MMKESDIVDYYEEFKSSFSTLACTDIDLKKVIPLAHRTYKQGRFESPGDTISSQEFIAATTLVALIANEKGRLKLCGEAYEVLVYLCMKTESFAQVNKFLYASIELLPAEIFEGVLRGLAAYDVENKSDTGKQLLQASLKGRTVKEVEDIAKIRTQQYWLYRIISTLEKPVLGAALGLLLGQIISSILFK